MSAFTSQFSDFAKDNDYTVQIVDSLLDLLTGGDHSRTKKILEEKKRLREEEEAIKTVLEVKPAPDNVKIDVEELRSLQCKKESLSSWSSLYKNETVCTALGIDTSFLDEMEDQLKLYESQQELQQRLDSMSHLLEKLQRTQYQRLSAPLPTNLNNLQPPSAEETTLAETITDSLAEMAKKVNPGDVAPVVGLRKAMGVATEMESDVPDLESELRQFLESEQALSQSPMRDDKTIEEILME